MKITLICALVLLALSIVIALPESLEGDERRDTLRRSDGEEVEPLRRSDSPGNRKFNGEEVETRRRSGSSLRKKRSVDEEPPKRRQVYDNIRKHVHKPTSSSNRRSAERDNKLKRSNGIF